MSGDSSLPKATVDPGEVRTTRTPSGRPQVARADVPPPRAAVWVPHAVLTALTPAEQSALAAHAELPLDAVKVRMESGDPIVLQAFAGARGAEEAAKNWHRRTGLPVEAVRTPGRLAWIAPVLVLLLAMSAASAALVLAVWSTVAAVLVAVLALGFATASVLGGVRLLRARSDLAAVAEAWALQSSERAALPAAAIPVVERIHALRLHLVDVDPPAPIASDLRSALADLERDVLDAASALAVLPPPGSDGSDRRAELLETLAEAEAAVDAVRSSHGELAEPRSDASRRLSAAAPGARQAAGSVRT